MPGFDGTGPSGQGPLTGQGRGFCVLKTSDENPGQVKGVTGLQSVPISQKVKNFKNAGKEVIDMPFGDKKGPPGMGPMTGRAAGFCADFPLPGHMNFAVNRVGYHDSGVPVFGPYGAVSYGYGARHAASYAGRFSPWLRRGYLFGRGSVCRWGRGRGRFGYWR